MRFRLAHKLVSYLLVTLSLLMLYGCDVLSPAWGLGLIAAVLASWPVDLESGGADLARRLDEAGMVLRIALLAFVGWSLWKVWRSLADPDITPVVHLAVVLLAYKLFHRRGNRDYLQLYILSFLIVLTSAALAQSVTFAVEFAVFAVLAVWTLILFHLRREMEDNYLVKHTTSGGSHKVGIERILNSRRVVGGWFFAATAITGLTVFIGASITFALVPRIGAGFLLGRVQRTKLMVGFSDDVVLGRHGVLSSDNQSVVLRAAVPALASIRDDETRDRVIAGLYWRGTVYDSYHQGHWVRSQRTDTRTVLQPRGDVTLVAGAERPSSPGARPTLATALAGTWQQEIDSFGAAAAVAFALDRPVGFSLPTPKPGTLLQLQLSSRWSGEVGLRMARIYAPQGTPPDARTLAGAHYVAYSRSSSAPEAGAGNETPGPSYLALPANNRDGSSPRTSALVELAARITAGHPTPSARIAAIRAWLQSSHAYTTDLRRDESVADPLEDFLFHQKAGHCEYFASATVMLMRAAGIPARYVNGFVGGEWNAIGQHVTVRDNRAHSWAEAFVPGQGWVRVDATPGAATTPARMSQFRQIFDSLELVWNRWVVEYDLGRQVDLARQLGRQLGVGNAGPRRQTSSPVLWRRMWPAAAAVALVLIARRLLRRYRRASAPGGTWRAPERGGEPIVRLYARAMRKLQARGHERRAAETPHEFSRRMGELDVQGLDALDQLTELYVGARYGRRAVDPDVVRELARRIDDVGKPLAA